MPEVCKSETLTQQPAMSLRFVSFSLSHIKSNAVASALLLTFPLKTAPMRQLIWNHYVRTAVTHHCSTYRSYFTQPSAFLSSAILLMSSVLIRARESWVLQAEGCCENQGRCCTVNNASQLSAFKRVRSWKSAKQHSSSLCTQAQWFNNTTHLDCSVPAAPRSS